VILVVVVLYVVIATWLSLYGFNLIMLSVLSLIHRKDQMVFAPLPSGEFPHVTVQLPIFNERYVVERLIDGAAALNWPHDKLHIQVLDDSTDETTGLARARAEFHRAHGVDVVVLHRNDRTGYKAGALAAGLAYSSSPFVAIFDADFVPEPGFLRRIIPAFSSPDVGWVQARWIHINESYSPLTHAIALPMDAHFVIEQVARSRGGMTTIFNGSAGIWRRTCIDQAGGWQGDTLTEDADLSFRAQMFGWRGMMMPDVAATSELPIQIAALKQQYFRWAKGGAQTLRKLWIPVVKSRMPLWKKVTGLFQLSGYLIPPLVILLQVTWLPIILHPEWINGITTTILSIATLGVPIEFALAQIILYRGDVRRILYLPIFMIVGTGMALNSARGVIQGLSGRNSEFMRTPKFRMEGESEAWKRSAYVISGDPTAFGEALMAGYAAFMIMEAWRSGNTGAIPFLLLYAAGFACVAIGSAVSIRPRGRRSTLRAKADAG
jgi:cellulose synthase/poly-beta-1,6-N-acetylglucosamine synthase-like glycosyltransferase